MIDQPVIDAERMLLKLAPNAQISRLPVGTPPAGTDLGSGIVADLGRRSRNPPMVELYISGQVPNLIGETRARAQRLLTSYGMSGTWRPRNATADSIVSAQDPGRGTRADWLTVVAVTLGPPLTQPSSAPTAVSDRPTSQPAEPAAGAGDPGRESRALRPSVSVALITAGASVLLLVALLAVHVLRPTKRGRWVRAHVRARAVGDSTGRQTTGQPDTTRDLSIRIRPSIDSGRHALEETGR